MYTISAIFPATIFLSGSCPVPSGALDIFYDAHCNCLETWVMSFIYLHAIPNDDPKLLAFHMTFLIKGLWLISNSSISDQIYKVNLISWSPLLTATNDIRLSLFLQASTHVSCMSLSQSQLLPHTWLSSLFLILLTKQKTPESIKVILFAVESTDLI